MTIWRVDRRGYSGTSHAARRRAGRYITLCGRDATGTGWHVLSRIERLYDFECRNCRRALSRQEPALLEQATT